MNGSSFNNSQSPGVAPTQNPQLLGGPESSKTRMSQAIVFTRFSPDRNDFISSYLIISLGIITLNPNYM